jgi:hypothetical protein
LLRPRYFMDPVAEPKSLLQQSCLCISHGGVSVSVGGGSLFNTLRFQFLIDASSCTASPQALFSIVLRHDERLLVYVEAACYPAAEGHAWLTAQVCERPSSCSTPCGRCIIPCGRWLAATLYITDDRVSCSKCPNTSSSADATAVFGAHTKFSLHLRIASAQFLISRGLARPHFHRALQLGAHSAAIAAQPSVFRALVGLVCSREELCSCCPPLHAFADEAIISEPGFLAPVALRCNALTLTGACCTLYTKICFLLCSTVTFGRYAGRQAAACPCVVGGACAQLRLRFLRCLTQPRPTIELCCSAEVGRARPSEAARVPRHAGVTLRTLFPCFPPFRLTVRAGGLQRRCLAAGRCVSSSRCCTSRCLICVLAAS